MKKFFALILTAVLLLTAIPVVYAENNTNKVGDIIQFGSYPQREVKDETLIAELNAIAPEWDDWTSYRYYSGTGEYGTMVQGDWMRYVDRVYNGEKYRGVKFTQYRPYDTLHQSLSSYTVQDNNGYNTNIVYWFRFEPIDWRVLDPNSGFVMCETIIDAQPYSNTIYYNSSISDSIYAYFNNSTYTNYASDYETSSIRQWLNDDFYNTAFTDSEKKEINTTPLNNDCAYTLYGFIGYEKLDSKPTHDKIFLLSCAEAENSSYGFSSQNNHSDSTRQAKGSDYAKSQGLSVIGENSSWLLRSPGDSSIDCCFVDEYGYINGPYSYEVFTNRGVRPAMHLEHSFLAEVTPPTCEDQGYTTYTCKCGYIYVSDYVDALGHSHTSQITTPATHLTEGVETYTCHCGDTYTKAIDKIAEHSHNAVVTEPTCTAKGFTIYACECGDTYIDDYIEANGHTFTTYISDGKATCITDGLKIAKCDYCDATDSIPEKGGHSFSDKWTIDTEPTCTEIGLKSHHCINCEEKTDITPIGKLANTYNKTIIEPTCTDKGYNVYTCSCGDTYTETIEALGHNFDGSACTECDYDKADDCSCNCHKDGIAGLIWKILNFFYKLLRINLECSCGAVHY